MDGNGKMWHSNSAPSTSVSITTRSTKGEDCHEKGKNKNKRRESYKICWLLELMAGRIAKSTSNTVV
jgi:hypothetical protein